MERLNSPLFIHIDEQELVDMQFGFRRSSFTKGAIINEAAVLANQQKRQTKGAKGQSASSTSQAETDQVAAKITLQADFHKILVDIGISIGCTISGDKQFGPLKIRRFNRN